MSFIAHALDEVEGVRIKREADGGCVPWYENFFFPFGEGNHWYVYVQAVQNFLGRRELAPASVNHDEVGPRPTCLLARRIQVAMTETSTQNFLQHGKIIRRLS